MGANHLHTVSILRPKESINRREHLLLLDKLSSLTSFKLRYLLITFIMCHQFDFGERHKLVIFLYKLRRTQLLSWAQTTEHSFFLRLWQHLYVELHEFLKIC